MIRHELVTRPRSVAGVASIVWDLTDGIRREYDSAGALLLEGSGPRVVDRDVEGLGFVELDVYGREAPRVAGRKRTGIRAKSRATFLPVLFTELGVEWDDIQRRFSRSIAPPRPFIWRVTSPGGTVRELEVFLDPEDDEFSKDPSQIRQAIGVPGIADNNPYWMGEKQVVLEFVQGNGISFFGPDSAAPLFYIDAGSAEGEHEFIVDGDIDAWPVLEVEGPLVWEVESLPSGRTVGGLELITGDTLRIDFAPTSQTAIRTRGGVEEVVTRLLPRREFFGLDPDEDNVARVRVAVTGAGNLRLSYRPLYWKGL